MIDFIRTFVLLNLIEVVGTLLVALIGLFLYKRGKTDFVRRIVLALVTEAEKRFGSGTGELKYCYVVERIYEVLPWIIRILYTKEQLDKMIEDAVEYLERYLGEGRDLTGY